MKRVRVGCGFALLLLLLAVGWLLRTYPGNQLVPFLAYLGRARPASELLDDPTLPGPTRDRLRDLLEVRSFAASLGLEVGKAYSRVSDDGGGPLVHGVTAAPVDRLEAVTWRYPVVGALSYRGFFYADEARAFAASLEGMDTHVRGASAFSGLGWLDEPLPSSALAWPREDLCGLVIHELLHRTVFFPGQTDLNESLATFVERRGLEEHLGRDLSERWAARDRQRQLLSGAADELRALYAGCSTREEALRRRAPVLERLSSQAGGGEWNNARLLGNLAYVGQLDRIADVHQRLGGDLRKTIRFFGEVDPRGDPWKQVEERLTAPSSASPGRSAP